jgi:hypothetical protein
VEGFEESKEALPASTFQPSGSANAGKTDKCVMIKNKYIETIIRLTIATKIPEGPKTSSGILHGNAALRRQVGADVLCASIAAGLPFSMDLTFSSNIISIYYFSTENKGKLVKFYQLIFSRIYTPFSLCIHAFAQHRKGGLNLRYRTFYHLYQDPIL